MRKLSILLLLFILAACFRRGPDPNEVPVAKVYDNYLYVSDLKGVIGPGTSPEDSVRMVQSYINKWINNQLLLHQAEQHLTNYEKDLQKKLDDYRTTILVHEYKENYLKEHLDTAIQEKEIEQYYTKYASNFLLSTPILKGLFLIVPRNSPESWRPRRWYRSDSSDDFLELEKYCADHNIDINYFEDDWISFDELDTIPFGYMTPERVLRRPYYETKDSMNYYWLKITDYHLKGTPSPLGYVKEYIKSILLSKKKMAIIRDLELNVFNDASNRGNITKYK